MKLKRRHVVSQQVQTPNLVQQADPPKTSLPKDSSRSHFFHQTGLKTSEKSLVHNDYTHSDKTKNQIFSRRNQIHGGKGKKGMRGGIKELTLNLRKEGGRGRGREEPESAGGVGLPMTSVGLEGVRKTTTDGLEFFFLSPPPLLIITLIPEARENSKHRGRRTLMLN